MAAPLRIVFMGTPEFAVPSLRAIAGRPDIAQILAVYTQPDRPAGRGQKLTKPPVKVVAEELCIPVHQPEDINDADEKRKLVSMMADVVVVVAYAQFLSNAILNTPRLGCVNVHSSLLPKYRGAAPIQYAIWKGEKVSGVSTMRLVKKMDAGPILLQRSIPIPPQMTGRELHDALAQLGGELIIETLQQLQAGTSKDIAQDESLVSYTGLLKKEDGLIRWENNGEDIINQIRAFDPWPGTFGRSTRGTLKILKAQFHPRVDGTPQNVAPGDAYTGAGSLLIRCANGWIELLSIQPEGRKPMSASEYLNGIRNLELKFEKGTST